MDTDVMTEPVSEEITYLPGPEDGVKTTWHGIVFHANVPKTVTKPLLIEQARTNKFFHVGPFDAAKAVAIAEQPPSPKTPEQYRAHAVAWLKTVKNVDELDMKWAGEETLRIECEAGTDDVDYLMSLILPKRAELRKMEQA